MKTEMKIPGLNKSVLALIILVISVHPFLYFQMYAGDAELHLIFGKNASQGRFFEFNPGEKSPGTTSVGYMLLLAILYDMFSERLVPLSVKVINILFWYALIALLFLIARQLLMDKVWALITALVAALLPGAVYNSTTGMENGIFAFVILLWIYLAMRLSWFMPNGPILLKREIVLGTLLGVAFWIRPEAIVFIFVALCYRYFLIIQSTQHWKLATQSALAFIIPFIALSCGLIYFQYSMTGFLLPSSGVARVISSWQTSVSVGPIPLNPRFLERLVFYLPLTVFFLLGNLRIFRSRREQESGVEMFMAIIFWVFFVLYSTFLGAAHLARYTIFIMPLMILIAIIGAKWVWQDWQAAIRKNLRPFRGLVFGILSLALCIIFGIETMERLKLGPRSELTHLMKAPEERRAYSDSLYAELGSPSTLPISLAYQEVQIRYWLDDRFVVRSLDGRIDPTLLRYVNQGFYDHIGYIKERHISYVMETANYNRNSYDWSLEELNSLQPGEAVIRQGLKFTRLSNEKIFRVEP